MTRAAIIAAYNRHEAAQGGLAKADCKECLRLAAEECGVTVAEARDVMVEAWGGMQG